MTVPGLTQRPSRHGLRERSFRPPDLARREPKNDRTPCRADRPVIRRQRGLREPWHPLGVARAPISASAAIMKRVTQRRAARFCTELQ